jgi:hypothetical protein
MVTIQHGMPGATAQAAQGNQHPPSDTSLLAIANRTKKIRPTV